MLKMKSRLRRIPSCLLMLLMEMGRRGREKGRVDEGRIELGGGILKGWVDHRARRYSSLVQHPSQRHRTRWGESG